MVFKHIYQPIQFLKISTFLISRLYHTSNKILLKPESQVDSNQHPLSLLTFPQLPEEMQLTSKLIEQYNMTKIMAQGNYTIKMIISYRENTYTNTYTNTCREVLQIFEFLCNVKDHLL